MKKHGYTSFLLFVSAIIISCSEKSEKSEYNKLSGSYSSCVIQFDGHNDPKDSLSKKIPADKPITLVGARLILSDTILGVALEKCGKKRNEISVHRSKFILTDNQDARILIIKYYSAEENFSKQLLDTIFQELYKYEFNYFIGDMFRRNEQLNNEIDQLYLKMDSIRELQMNAREIAHDSPFYMLMVEFQLLNSQKKSMVELEEYFKEEESEFNPLPYYHAEIMGDDFLNEMIIELYELELSYKNRLIQRKEGESEKRLREKIKVARKKVSEYLQQIHPAIDERILICGEKLKHNGVEVNDIPEYEKLEIEFGVLEKQHFHLLEEKIVLNITLAGTIIETRLLERVKHYNK